MVRLMRWMIGLMITSVSTVLAIKNFPAHFSMKNNKTNGNGGDDERDYDQLDPNSTAIIQSLDATIHLYEIGARRNCTPQSIGDFPPDFMNQEQRSKGGMVIHMLLACYACYALAAVCDTFFVPSLHLLSERMGLTSDVAGATLMAAGTSSPEFFESIIGSFITEGDIGVGTIVGSAVFNILAVTSVCGILTGMVVPLDWWPLTRDCAFYAVTVIALVFVIHDEKVYWYESTVLLVMFVLYVLMMYFNPTLSTFFNARFGSKKRTEDISTISNGHSVQPTPRVIDLVQNTAISIIDTTLSLVNSDKSNSTIGSGAGGQKNGEVLSVLLDENQLKQIDKDLYDDEDDEWSPMTIPAGSFLKKAAYFLTWPLNMVFYWTIPNCNRKRWRRFYPLTFFMSVLYIGTLSYFVAWMVTILGFTIGVPDTVMGITFLAIGTSVPEGYSSVIVCRKGLGNMAISNSVGSNVFDILFCLGLPWLIKALAFSTTGYVKINSSGIVYSAMSLLATVVVLYVVIAACDFKLNLKVGIICLILYSGFLAFASLVELNVFGNVNPPLCS